VRVFRHRTDEYGDLERQLRSDRPRPSRALLDQLVADAPARRGRSRNLVAGRLALAGLLTLILLGALAATGGVGQVASGGKVAAERVKAVVAAPFGQSKKTEPPSTNESKKTEPTSTNESKKTEPTSTNAATPNGGSLNALDAPTDPPGQDQYKPGCGRGDPNEPHTGPPGNNNGFPGRCPPSAPPPVTPLP
jgi:hypothetical protein